MGETAPKNNNIESLVQYKERMLKSYSDYLLKLKNYQEKITNIQLNQHFLEQIQNTKLEYEQELKTIVEKFEEEMKYIEESRARESDPNNLWAGAEELLKNSFRRQISTSELALKTTVEMYESKLK